MCTPPAAPVFIREVERRAVVEVLQRQRGIAEACGNDGVHGAAQRAAVPAARRIVIEVRSPDRFRERLHRQRQQRDNVGLLDDLRPLCALAAEHHVHRHGPARVGSKVDVLEPEVSGKLLEQAGRCVEAGDHRVGALSARPPIRRRPNAAVRRGRSTGRQTWVRSHAATSSAAPDVPARHDVGIGVVVDVLVIFVRADHVADVAVAVGLRRGAAGPEARGVQQDLCARGGQERVIAGGLPILPDRIGDVRA